jgi:anhydro-N-acetylmuramic acid kinase
MSDRIINKKALYIGLMSGTSADGIDLALVDFSSKAPKLVASYYQAYDKVLHQKIIQLYQKGHDEIDRAFALDIELAQYFSLAIQQFLQEKSLTSQDIIAIGNHGQTIRHRPNPPHSFTLQIGCNQTLATLTNIRVVGQFRRKDMALGGQGAPLVPAFHQALFQDRSSDTFIVNIGGIANITFLPATKTVKINEQTDQQGTILGFDTGPGNALMDDWYQQHHTGNYDESGHWAASGKVNQALLSLLLRDKYFHLDAPKSTGREVFNLAWLAGKLLNFSDTEHVSAQDIQATLTTLTAHSISDAINKLSSQSKVYLCGGGAHNQQLVNDIKQALTLHNVDTTNQLSIDGDTLEAFAFAWFAYAFDHKIIGNIPAVTGATKTTVLGTEYIS